MDKNLIADKVKSVIYKSQVLGRQNIDTRLQLDSHYGLDSVAMITLVVALEEEFGFEFEDEDLQLKRFSTVDHISDLIADKLLIRPVLK